jgi:UDP-glucose 4-epimerase
MKAAPRRVTPRSPARANTGRSIAVTGAAGFLGRRLLARLEADPNVSQIVALDLKPPAGQLRKTAFERVDLSSPRADAVIAAAVQRAHADTFVHLALFFDPIQNASYAHEVEVIGTLQLLGALAATPVGSFIACSTTTLYGAHPDNPTYIRESAPLRPPANSRYFADKLEVEREIAAFATQNPKTRVAILRLGSMLGPNVRNPATRLFGRPLVPTVLGRDPLVQFLHEEDAVEALVRAVQVRPQGPFNIVPPGVLPLSSVLRMLGRTALPLPSPVARSGLAALWSVAGIGTPPSWLDYLRYLWVADGSLATKELGLTYRYSTRETVLAFGAARGQTLAPISPVSIDSPQAPPIATEVSSGA